MATCANCGAGLTADARFCASCGAPVGGLEGEERKIATILFADLSGSTRLGERLDPERLRTMLQEYFAAMASAIETWGGTVEKYIGDAVMAVFGVPTAREDDPERALRAATEMLSTLGALNLEFERTHGVQLQLRIGVNTGEVIAPLGARSAGQFIASGDAVNVAARLEQAAEPEAILVGERTHQATRHAFRFGPPMQLDLRGKGEPVVGRRLLEAIAQGGRGLEFQAPMVGRDRELATLVGLLDAAMQGDSAQVGIVVGPAGMGKSRLLREFMAAARARQAELVAVRGRCVAAGHGITFWALGEVLRAACGISLDDSAESAEEKLRRRVEELLEALQVGTDEVGETIEALATTANIRLEVNRLEGREPEAVAEAMGHAWPRFLTGLAQSSPAVVLLEDLHWADEQMLGMVGLLATRSRGRLLILATARPDLLEAHPAFAAGLDNLTAITLRPLSESEAARLVEGLLSEAKLPDELSSEILMKADGNPFFLEEIIQRLIDEGALTLEGDGWRATAHAEEVRLPDSVHALLAARIDALPSHEKRLMQEAAVIGRAFWRGPLAETLPDVDVAQALLSLERRGLVRAQPTSSIGGENEYLFRHVLIRDVAYASVPKSRRARAHADVAAWIERLAGERIDEFGELVAHHYRSAVAGEDADLAWTSDAPAREEARRKAVHALVAAGAFARRRFAVTKALELHHAALELAETDEERIATREALGDDHDALFHGDEGIAEYLEVARQARSVPGGEAAIARVAVKAAQIASRFGAFRSNPDPQALEELVAEGLASAGADDETRARLLIAKATLRIAWMGRQMSRGLSGEADPVPLSDRMRFAEEGLAIAERLDQPELVYLATDVLFQLHAEANDEEAREQDINRQLALLPRLGITRQRADILFNAAALHIGRGDYRRAIELAEQGYAMAPELSPHEAMHASYVIMMASYLSGAWDRVLELLPDHSAAANREPEVTCGAVRGGPILGALVMTARGRLDEALEEVRLAEIDSPAISFMTSELLLRYVMALGRQDLASALLGRLFASATGRFEAEVSAELLDALPRLGRWKELEEVLSTARSHVRSLALMAPRADRAEAALLRHRGQTDEAVEKLRDAVGGFDRLGMPFEAALAREELAELTPDERRALLEASLATYQHLDAAPHTSRVRSALSNGGQVAD